MWILTWEESLIAREREREGGTEKDLDVGLTGEEKQTAAQSEREERRRKRESLCVCVSERRREPVSVLLLTERKFGSSFARPTTTPMAPAHAADAAAAALSSPRSFQYQQQLVRHWPRPWRAFPRRSSLPLPRSSIGFSGFLGSRIDRAVCSRSINVQNGRSASWVPPVSEVAVDSSLNAAAVAASKVDGNSAVEKEVTAPAATREATVSAFMADVANLIKLVDSRDIVELELKHLDYEILIRKKEALPPPPVPPQSFPHPQFFAQTPFSTISPPLPVEAPAPVSSPTTGSTPEPVTASAVPPPTELPPMLSPMAGTFYRSPAPGEPAYVKVGDKVQKGQVICIVEAMKLMNEIEADRTGTIVDILAEDKKPVSVDTPLFAIKP